MVMEFWWLVRVTNTIQLLRTEQLTSHELRTPCQAPAVAQTA